MPKTKIMITAADWRKQTGRLFRSTQAGEVLDLLKAYEQVDGGNVKLRLSLLRALKTVITGYVTSAHTTNGGRNHTTYFLLLRHAVEKEEKTIGVAHAAWGQIKRVFGPSGTGKTLALGHVRHDENKPTARANYWLEAADPKNRSWGHQPEGIDLFEKWRDSSTKESFWKWLETQGKGDLESVQYLAPDERWRYMIRFAQGLLWQADDNKALWRFSTRLHRTHASKDGFAIWVASPRGTFYSHSHTVNQFHHSSFLAGSRVLAAGEWAVQGGQLVYISHKTGHYRASPADLIRALALLRLRVDLSKVVADICTYDLNVEEHHYVWADDYLRLPSLRMCPPVNLAMPKEEITSSILNNLTHTGMRS
jgi:hypothetical protein